MLEHLTLYPDVPSERRGQVVRDLLTLALIVLFVWIGVQVYHLVDALSVLGEGVSHAGDSIQGGFDSVGSAVANVPIVRACIHFSAAPPAPVLRTVTDVVPAPCASEFSNASVKR